MIDKHSLRVINKRGPYSFYSLLTNIIQTSRSIISVRILFYFELNRTDN